MVVICPKCKTRLKVDEGKLSKEVSRFKCPKCSTVLLVKKPVSAPVRKEMDKGKILVAHSNPAVINVAASLLTKNGFQTISVSDGIEAMVKAIKELPFLAIVEVSLPKIFGFEVCRRLKARDETKDMKFILITSVYDKKRYKREPESLYEADDYLEEHSISEILLEKVNRIKGITPEEKEEKLEKPPVEPTREIPEEKPEITPQPFDERIERAKRLARTIISDIYLYNTAKAEEAIKNNTFFSVFAPEVKEGLKLFESRISQEVRDKGDFFKQAIEDFIAKKKKA